MPRMANQKIYENAEKVRYYWLNVSFRRLLFGSPKMAIFYRYTISIVFIEKDKKAFKLRALAVTFRRYQPTSEKLFYGGLIINDVRSQKEKRQEEGQGQ